MITGVVLIVHDIQQNTDRQQSSTVGWMDDQVIVNYVHILLWLVSSPRSIRQDSADRTCGCGHNYFGILTRLAAGETTEIDG